MTEEIYSEVQKRLATVKLFSEAKINSGKAAAETGRCDSY